MSTSSGRNRVARKLGAKPGVRERALLCSGSAMMMMRRLSSPFAPAFVLALSACGGNDTYSPYGSSTNASVTATVTASAGTGTGEAGDGDGAPGDGDGAPGDGDGDGGTKLDVLGGDTSMTTTGMEGGDAGCEKVDFLFVIDNSNSMSDEQQLLIDSFPGFIDTIQATLPSAADFHIGVTKTDVFGFDDNPTPDPNNPCAYVLGGLLTHATPDGEKTATGLDCEFDSGANYMTDGPMLADEFACVARVGTKGNTGERQAEATLAALDPNNTCSQDFLRKDALTVIVVITDEDDDWSPPDSDAATNAQAWYDGVVAAEDGIESNVVFLLISGGSPKWGDCGPLDLMTMTGADDSPKLTAWAQKFSNANLGSVCSTGYADYLAQSIAVIETACDGFEPIP
jgi:hypothetical protein